MRPLAPSATGKLDAILAHGVPSGADHGRQTKHWGRCGQSRGRLTPSDFDTHQAGDPRLVSADTPCGSGAEVGDRTKPADGGSAGARRRRRQKWETCSHAPPIVAPAHGSTAPLRFDSRTGPRVSAVERGRVVHVTGGIGEAALVAIARKLAARLSEPAMKTLEARVRLRLGRTPSEIAIREALGEAIAAFSAVDTEHMAHALFDEHFFRHRARDALLRALDPFGPLPVDELADAWRDQFRFTDPTNDVFLVPACETFLMLFRHAVRNQDEFREVFDSARIDAIHEKIDRITLDLDYNAALTSGRAVLAEPIRYAYSTLGQTVEELTRDQYRVLELLRHFKRALISGTAGSGKTLLAAEKAMRSAAAGHSTLFCCHNPELASWVAALTDGTRVEVVPFEHLVRTVGKSRSVLPRHEWSAYSQPTTDELDRAFDAIVDGNFCYDAVIVDEGQDFAGEWWLVIEALLAADDSQFYIFYDDQQALLTRKVAYPINSPPLDLSRNCRNAGQIYRAMRVLAPGAPAPEGALARHGVVMIETAAPTLVDAVTACVKWLAERDALRSTTVLLGGGTAVEESALGPWLGAQPLVAWRSAVLRALTDVIRRLPEAGREASPSVMRLRMMLRELSDNDFPTDADIDLVAQVAAQIHTPPQRGARRPQWATREYAHWDGPAFLASDGAALRDVVEYFQTPRWALEMETESPGGVRFARHGACRPPMLPIYTVGEFKGLESDVVLLVMQGNAPEVRNELFVGISRARETLAVALDHVALSQLTGGEQRALGLAA